MYGGELLGIGLKGLLMREDLPINEYLVDEAKTNILDFNNILGRGYQGIIVSIINEPTKVAKLFKLKILYNVPDLIKESIIPSYYASNIRIGPKIYDVPFITTDGNFVGFIMEKVVPYVPNENDVNEIIELYKKSIDNNFITYDNEFAKTLTEPARIIFIDFGVSGIYENPEKTLFEAINNDIFANRGAGFYSPIIEKYFNDLKKGGQIIKNKKKIKKNKTNKKNKKNKKNKINKTNKKNKKKLEK